MIKVLSVATRWVPGRSYVTVRCLKTRGKEHWGAEIFCLGEALPMRGTFLIIQQHFAHQRQNCFSRPFALTAL